MLAMFAFPIEKFKSYQVRVKEIHDPFRNNSGRAEEYSRTTELLNRRHKSDLGLKFQAPLKGSKTKARPSESGWADECLVF